MVGSAATFCYLGIPSSHRFSLSLTSCFTGYTHCCYTKNVFCMATSQLQWPGFHLWIIHCPTQSHTNPKLPNAPCTHEQWCRCGHTLQLLDVHKETQIQMDTHACKCSRMQNKHTLGFGVLVSILSLSPSLCLSGGLAVVIWHTAAIAAVLFYACGDASLLVCILYVWLYVCSCMTMCICIFLYVSLLFAWLPFLPPRCCAVLPSGCVI